MRITQIRVASKITKSANYQSGTGEVELTAEISEGDDVYGWLKDLKDDVVREADTLADEALAKCTRRK